MKRKRKEREIFDTSVAPDWLNEESKAAWPTLPELLKQAVIRRIAELERGLAMYEKKLANVLEGLGSIEEIRKYDAMAKARGLELKDLLAHYYSIENRLMADPIDGLRHIWSIYGDGRPFERFWLDDLIPFCARLEAQGGGHVQ